MTLYLFSITSFRIFYVYSLKETKLLLLLHSFILWDASCGMCFAFDVLWLNQCYFYHQPAVDTEYVYVRACISSPLTVCVSSAYCWR